MSLSIQDSPPQVRIPISSRCLQTSRRSRCLQRHRSATGQSFPNGSAGLRKAGEGSLPSIAGKTAIFRPLRRKSGRYCTKSWNVQPQRESRIRQYAALSWGSRMSVNRHSSTHIRIRKRQRWRTDRALRVRTNGSPPRAGSNCLILPDFYGTNSTISSSASSSPPSVRYAMRFSTRSRCPAGFSV